MKRSRAHHTSFELSKAKTTSLVIVEQQYDVSAKTFVGARVWGLFLMEHKPKPLYRLNPLGPGGVENRPHGVGIHN